MALSRKTKAMLIWRLNPWFLMKITLALGVFVMVFQVASLVSLAFQYSLPQITYGLLFVPLLGVQGFRWWAIARGWSLVCVNDVSASNLQEQLLGNQTDKLPLEVQQALVKKAHELGWLTWADVIAAANEAGLSLTKPHTSVFLGGHRSRIARPKDWKAAVEPQAWRAGCMEAKLHNVVPPTARPRF